MNRHKMLNPDVWYCKIYVDADIDIELLVHAVALQVSGATEGTTVVTENVEIDVRRNEDYIPRSHRSAAHDFVYHRYYFDVVPAHNLRLNAGNYIKEIAELIASMQKKGIPITASCDYEDKLNSLVTDYALPKST